MNDAKNYASGQADIFKQSLQYLVEQQNQQKLLDEQALSQRYTNLVNQVNQKRLPIEQQFGQDAKGAYVNKMLSQQNVNDSLNRMNLSNSGFGMGQRIGVDSAYGQNLNQLMINRNNQLTGLENQITNLQGQQQSDMLGLQSTYAGRLGDLNKYIAESVNNKYQQEYSNYMAQKQYEDRLKQQAIDNTYRVNALNASVDNPFDDTPVVGDGPSESANKLISDIENLKQLSKKNASYGPINATQISNIVNEAYKRGQITERDVIEILNYYKID